MIQEQQTLPADPVIDAAWFRQPLRIGALEVANRALLSPLAGVSDVPFRRICSELGAGLCWVEMMSCIGISRRTPRTMNMLARHPSEHRLGVQLTGATADDVAGAARILDGEGFDTIDINMGCPVRKIVNKGWGSAILREPQRVFDTVARTREAVGVPVSAKIRLGWTAAEQNAEEVSRRVAEAGADLLTIHGRCRGDAYAVPIDYPAMAAAFRAARAVRPLPVVGNGNVMDAPSARRMVRETGCDAVLVSRGALGNPWIFRQILEGSEAQPTVAEWSEVLLRHLAYVREHYGDRNMSAICFRKHLIWYVSGFPNSRKMRPVLTAVDSLEEAAARIRAYADGLPPDLPRYHDGPSWNGEDLQARFDPKYDMDRSETEAEVEEEAE